jgi:hypothetical protein
MAPFIGPAIGRDGLLLRVEALNTRGVAPDRRRTRLVVDDFGNAVCYARRCSECKRWLPLTFEHYCVAERDALGMQPRCRDCTSVGRARWENDNRERSRANKRAAEKRRCQDPEYINRKRAYWREYRQRLQSDPVLRARRLEEQRRYRAKLAKDANRLARNREVDRMGARLRTERTTGKLVTELRTATPKHAPKVRAVVTTVPAAPLAAVLMARVRMIERREMMWSGEKTQSASGRKRVCRGGRRL